MAEVTKIDAFVQSSPHPAWLATSGGECLYFNPALERLIGLKFDEINQVDWQSFILAEDRAAASASWQRSRASGTPYRTTVRLRGFDGTSATVELIAFGHKLDDGTELWLFTGLDPHGGTQQYAGLEAQLQATLNVIPAYTWYALPYGALAFVNERTADSLDLPKDHPLRFGIDTGAAWDCHIPMLHPDDQEEARRVWSVCLSTGSAGENSQRVCNAKGEYRWFLSRAEPLRASDGTLLYWIGVNLDIDERKKAEEQLLKSARERERELVSIIETIPSMLWSTSPTGESTHNSQRLLEYVGVSHEEFVNRGWLSFVHPDDREESAKVFFCAIETGESYNVIHRIRHADGEYRWHQTRGEPLRGPDGTIVQWYGLSIDIDERKRAEDKVRLSEKELRALVETIPAFVGTALPDGSCDFLSDSWLDYLGFTVDQGLGWGWASSIHPEDVDRVTANWRAGLAAGESVEQELRCRSADGTYHWFLNRDSPLRDDEGNVVKWYGTLTNIDALKTTETALQMREHELLSIVDTVPSMLWSTSPTGESTHLSQRFREYWGVSFEEIANRGWVNLIHPDDREDTTEAFFRAIETGDSFSTIQCLRRADGEYRWHHSMGEPLRDSDGKIIQWYGLSIDIDERKRTEDHLRDTRVKLTTALRIATVAELSASIAHELNQPLMAVLGNAQAAKRWLAANPPDLAETTASIERVLRDIRSADTTMQHIRALFKREPYEKSSESVLDIIRDSLRFVRESPNKRDVEIVWSIEGSLPLICVDRIQAQQVFINLISNAIEATDGNINTARILLSAFATQEHEVVVQVIDNGTGLEDTEKIFDAFMTTKEKGLGIGLAVSKTIVEAHGGRLWAKNNPGGGATFNVALPMASKGGSNGFEVEEPCS